MANKILTYIVLLWWIPYMIVSMITDIINAKKELRELKKKTGRK